MSRLILINGAPSSGKSTLAHGFADQLPLSLILDIDTIRRNLGRWRDDPIAAGLSARRLALVMATSHLDHGYDVLVPQFLQRPGFIMELETATHETASQFIEVALYSSAHEAAQRFFSRTGTTDPNHVDAQHLQAQRDADSIEEMYTGMMTMLRQRPNTRYVESVPDAIDQTLVSLVGAVNEPTDPKG